ncbi:unnamed protein product [Ixodes pacificus]
MYALKTRGKLFFYVHLFFRMLYYTAIKPLVDVGIVSSTRAD